MKPSIAPQGLSVSSYAKIGRKLYIWHIAETYPPGYGGGAAIYIQDVCRFLASQGHEVRVLCVDNNDSEPYSIRTDFDGDVRVDRINLPYFRTIDPEGWNLGIIGWRKHQRKIVRLIHEMLSDRKPDLVSYNASRPLGEECIVEIGSRDIPIVAMLHEAWVICPRLMLLRSPTSEPCEGPRPGRCLECMYSYYDRTHKRAMLKLPWRLLKLGLYPAYRLWRRSVARGFIRGAIGYSQFMVSKHKPHLSGPTEYIQLGINLTGLPPRQPPRLRTPLRLGFVAGFQQHKGIKDVLEAAARLKAKGLVFELHIWGPDCESGLGEVSARGLDDRVFVRGMYKAEDIWDVYGEIDVAMMATTVCEPLGRVPLEAAAVGVPTIAPAIGGITETIRDGVDGLLYEFRNVDDLERQMQRVIQEPGLVENLISNLRAVPDTRQRASGVEQFYMDLLESESRLPAPSRSLQSTI